MKYYVKEGVNNNISVEDIPNLRRLKKIICVPETWSEVTAKTYGEYSVAVNRIAKMKNNDSSIMDIELEMDELCRLTAILCGVSEDMIKGLDLEQGLEILEIIKKLIQTSIDTTLTEPVKTLKGSNGKTYIRIDDFENITMGHYAEFQGFISRYNKAEDKNDFIFSNFVSLLALMYLPADTAFLDDNINQRKSIVGEFPISDVFSSIVFFSLYRKEILKNMLMYSRLQKINLRKWKKIYLRSLVKLNRRRLFTDGIILYLKSLWRRVTLVFLKY